MKESMPLLVTVTRGQLDESRHLVSCVVVDLRGETRLSFGAPDLMISPRSAIKPAQCISFVESGAIEMFSLGSQHIAFACSSHAGESAHIDLAMNWRNQLNLVSTDFVCGGHWPQHVESAHELIRKRQSPTAEYNNCSGKHLGLLSTCLSLKWPIENYGGYEHPLQVRLRNLLTELSDYDYHRAPWGIDGCGIPTYGVPLVSVAKTFASLLTTDQHAIAKAKILAAISENPFFLAGTEELATQIAKITHGRVILKVGAEGVYCGLSRALNLAFAVKAHDGAARAAEAAVCALLVHLKWLSTEEQEHLQRFFHPVVKNWKGLEVGAINALIAKTSPEAT